MHIFTGPPVMPKDESIFLDNVDELVKASYPDHEDQHPLFKKFGYRTGGVTDQWAHTSDWQKLEEVDKWKYVALCSYYWMKQYEYQYERKSYDYYKDSLKKWGKKNPQFLETLRELENKENFIMNNIGFSEVKK